MKVALDVSAVPPKVAGAGRYVVEIASRLTARTDLELVTRRGDERWAEWVPGATLAPLVPAARLARLASEAWRLGVSAPARRADVWHAPHYTMPHRGDTPTVVTVHDLTFFTNPEWHESAKVAFFTRAIRYAARHAAAIICVSELTSRMLHEFVTPSVPVVVAPHGVDLARFTPHDADDERRLAEVGIEGPYVAFVGTLEPRKGLDVVLDAFATLAAVMPELRLVVVGQRGWGMGPIETALATHPAAERIIQPGYLADSLLPAFLRHARAVVYPSRGEGFGLPVLEALACGAPVVTTRGTVMEEVAGGAARLVPIGDATATAAALRELIDLDDGARMAIGDLGRARASEFTWERSIERHLEAYALASGRPA